tara:strand:+ start:428 stop:865 length:438 start_codon:yes stop_codon:yes gene_type:complete
VHPALEAGRLKDLILSVEKSMHNAGGETCAINIWGKKKLAYPINKEKYGMYILFQFKSDGSSNKEFNLGLEHNANVLAYLTTKIEEEGVLLDLPDLDNQLGLSNIKTEDTNKNDKSKDSEISKTEEKNDDKKEDLSSDDKNEENE